MIQRFGNKGIFILICAVIVAIIIDVSIIRIATSIGGIGPTYIALFAGMVIVFGAGQYVILSHVKNERRYTDYQISRYTRGRSLIEKALTISQYVLSAILVSVILQMLFASSYHIFSLEAIILISYGLSFVLLAFLAKRFFTWFKSNRNLIVLVYGLATALLSINSVVAIIYTTNEFATGPQFIRNVKSLTGGYEAQT